MFINDLNSIKLDVEDKLFLPLAFHRLTKFILVNCYLSIYLNYLSVTLFCINLMKWTMSGE